MYVYQSVVFSQWFNGVDPQIYCIPKIIVITSLVIIWDETKGKDFYFWSILRAFLLLRSHLFPVSSSIPLLVQSKFFLWSNTVFQRKPMMVLYLSVSLQLSLHGALGRWAKSKTILLERSLRCPAYIESLTVYAVRCTCLFRVCSMLIFISTRSFNPSLSRLDASTRIIT